MILKMTMLGLMLALTLGTSAGIVYRATAKEVKPPATPTRKGIPAGAVDENKCLVTILGNIYDVTDLAQTHSGPRGTSKAASGFFECGTDMTWEYTKEHGRNLSQMAKYLATGVGSNGEIKTTTENLKAGDDNENREEEWED